MGLSIRNLFGKRVSSKKSWKEIEYFDESWKERIKNMSLFIPKETQTVMDLGCGKMWLKNYLSAECKYYGIDYKDRGEGSEVYDLNKYQIPSLIVDVIFISGCLEYIEDYEWLIKEVVTKCKLCIISYCVLDTFSNIKERRSLTWVNDLTEIQLIHLFGKNKMKLTNKSKTKTDNCIYIFEHE